jgi:hypothetical protein
MNRIRTHRYCATWANTSHVYVFAVVGGYSKNVLMSPHIDIPDRNLSQKFRDQ